ncbi:MAG: hypothetical protein IKR67_01510 [Lachnospiraceae bacterium]|nr:hypothetical protein [Lachnospiraceae bacterium]
MNIELENAINNRLELLKQTAKRLELQKTIQIPGRLRISSNEKGTRYFYVQSANERQGRYISKNNIGFASALAQKSYNEHMKDMTYNEMAFLAQMKEKYPKNTFDNYLDSLPDARQSLISPIWLSDEEYTRQWLAQKYTRKEFSQHDTAEHITNAGIRVRSKSEVMIANELDDYGLPFLVELPLYLEGLGWVNPDFTILIARLRKIYIWEHHGLLDSSDYRENFFLKKNAAYIANGFLPGKNLIQNFESQKNPLSIPVIKEIIEGYLL